MRVPSILLRHQRRVLTGSALAVVGALVIVGAVAYLGSETDAGVGDPSERLQCPSGLISVATFTHDGETVETASPEEIADRWAVGTAEERALTGRFLDVTTRDMIQRSESTVDVAYSDTSGETVAVMSLIKDSRLGWRIESIVECGEGDARGEEK